MQWSKQGTAVPSRCPPSSTRVDIARTLVPLGHMRTVSSDKDPRWHPSLPKHRYWAQLLSAAGVVSSHLSDLRSVLAFSRVCLYIRGLTELPGLHDFTLILHRVPPMSYDIDIQQVSFSRLKTFNCFCGHCFLQILTVEIFTEDFL